MTGPLHEARLPVRVSDQEAEHSSSTSWPAACARASTRSAVPFWTRLSP